MAKRLSSTALKGVAAEADFRSQFSFSYGRSSSIPPILRTVFIPGVNCYNICRHMDAAATALKTFAYYGDCIGCTALRGVDAHIKIKRDGVHESATIAPTDLPQQPSWDVLYDVKQLLWRNYIAEEKGLPQVDVLPVFKTKMSADNMFFAYPRHS